MPNNIPLHIKNGNNYSGYNFLTPKVVDDTEACTTIFTSSDDSTTTETTSDGLTSVATMTSGETHASLFQKISKMFLNIRKLWNTVGFETEGVNKIIGDTSVTFTNSAIQTTSELHLLSENASNTPVFYTAVSVSSGSATYTFPALTEATTFSLVIK